MIHCTPNSYASMQVNGTMELDKSQQAKHIQFEMRCMGEGFVKGEMVQWHIQSYGSGPHERMKISSEQTEMETWLKYWILPLLLLLLNGGCLKEVLNWVFWQNMRIANTKISFCSVVPFKIWGITLLWDNWWDASGETNQISSQIKDANISFSQHWSINICKCKILF